MHILTIAQKAHICLYPYLIKILLSFVRPERSLAFAKHSYKTFHTKYISR